MYIQCSILAKRINETAKKPLYLYLYNVYTCIIQVRRGLCSSALVLVRSAVRVSMKSLAAAEREREGGREGEGEKGRDSERGGGEKYIEGERGGSEVGNE